MKRVLCLFIMLLLLTGCTTVAVEDPVEEPEEIVEEEPEKEPEELPEEEIEEEPVDDNPVPYTLRPEYAQPERYEEYLKTIEEPAITADVTFNEFTYARLYIPDASVDQIVIGGVDSYDSESIQDGPAHFELTDFPSTKPGTNVEIGAHVWNPDHFHNIDQLEEGDLVYLEMNGFRFTYEVLWQKILDKYDWSVTNEKPDYPALTLTTCAEKGDPDPPNRLYVRCKLIEVSHMQ